MILSLKSVPIITSPMSSCKGLVGEEIPLAARIIAVADAYDAMTYGRPYKEPLTAEAAIEEITAGKHTQFDPEIADIFLRVMSENNNEL